MEIKSVLLADLLLDTRDGDWGQETPSQSYKPYKVIRGADFPSVRYGDLSTVPMRYISESSGERRTLRLNDIIIETAGGTNERPTGRTLLVTNRIINNSDLSITCASFCRFLRVNPLLADPRYVYWYLQYLYEKGEMWQHQVQHTGIARFQYTRFANTISIPLPDPSVQQAIAHILSTLDEKIELNRQMIETLEVMAKAIFKSWFVDFDPVRAKMEGYNPYGFGAETAELFPDLFEDSDLGEIPEGWVIKPIDQIADFLNGLALQKYRPESDEFLPVIKIAELKKGVSESSDKASPHIEKKYIIEDGDVIFSWSGSLEVVIWCGGKGALNQHLFKVTSSKYPKWFYYQWIKYHLPEFQAIAAGKATTMGHIQRHHLSQALTIIPPENILNIANQVMAPIWDLIVNNEKESQSLASIRDILLPKLLSGEIRVKEAEKVVEAHL